MQRLNTGTPLGEDSGETLTLKKIKIKLDPGGTPAKIIEKISDMAKKNTSDTPDADN